ncbi:putative transposase, partial [Nitrosospira sp. Nsp11]
TLPHKTVPFKSRISGMILTLNGKEHDVKRSKFTEQQIAFALKQAELGTPVEEVCRKMGISDATFYNWKKKYGGLGPSELRRLKQLEEENTKLKRLVADLSLDKTMLQDVLSKKL